MPFPVYIIRFIELYVVHLRSTTCQMTLANGNDDKCYCMLLSEICFFARRRRQTSVINLRLTCLYFNITCSLTFKIQFHQQVSSILRCRRNPAINLPASIEKEMFMLYTLLRPHQRSLL